MRAYLAAASFLLLISGPAVADPLLSGERLIAKADGQPFCLDMDSLKEYVTALLASDRQWADQVAGCRGLQAGASVAVIEDVNAGNDAGHVVKVRLFAGNGSVVGYTISTGLARKGS